MVIDFYAIRNKRSGNLLGFKLIDHYYYLIDYNQGSNLWAIANEAMASNVIINGAIWALPPTDFYHPKHQFDPRDLEVVKIGILTEG